MLGDRNVSPDYKMEYLCKAVLSSVETFIGFKSRFYPNEFMSNWVRYFVDAIFHSVWSLWVSWFSDKLQRLKQNWPPKEYFVYKEFTFTYSFLSPAVRMAQQVIKGKVTPNDSWPLAHLSTEEVKHYQ